MQKYLNKFEMRVRVGTYNTLAQSLAKADWFPGVPHAVLKWSNRWPKMVRGQRRGGGVVVAAVGIAAPSLSTL